MSRNISRRSFMKGVVASVAGVAAAGLLPEQRAAQAEEEKAAGTKYSPFANPEEIGIVHEAQAEEEAAVVYVGTGIGGMMGAMICAEQMPDAKVLLIEKNGYCGGNTNFAERNGPVASVDWDTALRNGMDVAAASSWQKDGRLYAERAYDYGKNSGWLYLKHHWKLHQSEDGGRPMYEGGNGAACIRRLVSEIESDATYANLELRLNTRATALLLEDPYTVKGVQLRNADGTYTNVYAKAVVLATGGVSNNFDLLQYYSGQDLSKCEVVGVGQDGDGHLMVEQTAHGRCKTIALSSMYNHVKGFNINSLLSVAASMNPTALMVNQEGIRFVNESILSDIQFSKAIEQQGKVFSIIGRGLLTTYEQGGMPRMKPLVGLNRAFEPWDATEDLEANKDNENMVVADTLEELAEKIGVPVDSFMATINRYEADCAAGQGDTLFGKSAEYMLSQGEGPYYAFRISSVIFNTNNGIRVNGNAQVVDPEFNPIQGLYAAGICMSGFNEPELYSVATCQSSSVWAGSKAARHLIVNCCGREVADDWYGEEYTADSVVEYDNK